MELEKLNKSQIVLLTLLVSFVTSIATGIVTITLMEQAPPAVTQTVNRIVERTVQTVVPGEVAGASQTVVTETVIVRESQLISEAVAAAEPSIVRLFVPSVNQNGEPIEQFAGLAIVVSEQGELVADAGTPEGVIMVLRSDGVKVPANISQRPPGSKFMRLQAATSVLKDGTSETLSWKPAKFTTSRQSAGQSVVAVGGTNASRVAGGIITGTSGIGDDNSDVLETDIAIDTFAAGSPLISADGIVGMATRESRGVGAHFLASSEIPLYNNSPTAAEAPPQ
ncbi:MAG: trypsin-like peptidase domain-containing protein [Minisyncoccia bacterium]